MNIISLVKTPSTEDYIRKRLKKYIAAGEDVAVIAQSQTKGRGTKGRSFSAEKGGAYLSFLKFHAGLKAVDAHLILRGASVAVVKTLKAFNVNAQIKWPNDIVVDGKKICGILTENSFIGDYVNYSILGVGLNVNNALPEELKNIATTASEVLNKELDLKAVIATLLYNFSSLTSKQNVELYSKYSCVLGRKIRVIKFSGEEYFATAKEVLADGRLLLEGGEVLSAAEISLKLD